LPTSTEKATWLSRLLKNVTSETKTRKKQEKNRSSE